MAIIITKDGRNAQKIDRNSFENEDTLQSYIYQNPDSVPLYEIDENIRLLILAREFPTSSGPIDALGIDAKGEIYIIETKLYKNPDKRLVVAQMLDYGAALSFNYIDFGTFLEALEAKVSQHFRINMHQKISDFFDISEDVTSDVIENIRTNLDKGKFRFVVLMDKLEKRLKDLIVFLNQNSRFDIYGVELEYYRHKEFEIMIPKLFGAEVKKEVSTNSQSGGTRRKWDERSFFEELKNNLSRNNVSFIKDFYDFAVKTTDKISWGTGSQRGSFNLIYKHICPRSIFSVYSDGELVFNHFWMEDDEQMRAYRDAIISDFTKFFDVSVDQSQFKWTIDQWVGKIDLLKQSIEKLK